MEIHDFSDLIKRFNSRQKTRGMPTAFIRCVSNEVDLFNSLHVARFISFYTKVSVAQI